MAKQQEFIDLFPKHDSDNDGEITKEEFIALANELGVPSLYPGSVANMIRKLNYASPNKETINIQQAKEYIFSFDTPSKHDIWKAKYGLIAGAAQIRGQMNGDLQQAAAPAAPGAPPTDNSNEPKALPKNGRINILVGPPKASYNSQVNITIQKVELQNKPKPFVKLTFTSQTNERAKTLQTMFKQNFNTLLSLFAQDIENWAEEMKNFHINSMVNDTTTTFFFTTANEDIVDLIKVFTEMFELTYNYQLHVKAHAKFEFDYDFQKFVDEPQSSFHDIFTKNFKLSADVKVLNFMQSFRKFGATSKISQDIFCSNDIIVNLIPLSLLHLEEVDADLQFENSDIVDYQTQTKEQLVDGLKGLGVFFTSLNEGGMKVYELLQLMDGNITVEATAGQWNAKVFLRLKNINNVFLKLAKFDPPAQDNEDATDEAVPHASDSDSENSYTVEKKKPQKNASKSLKKKAGSFKGSEVDSQSSELSQSSIKEKKPSNKDIKVQLQEVQLKANDDDSDRPPSVHFNDGNKKEIKKEEDVLSDQSSSN